MDIAFSDDVSRPDVVTVTDDVSIVPLLLLVVALPKYIVVVAVPVDVLMVLVELSAA